YHAHPLNRGWMNTFRRWTATEAFQRFWPILAGTYSKDFVEFCERTLNVQPPSTHLVRMCLGDEARWQAIRAELNHEFAQEWSGGALDDHAAVLGSRRETYLDSLIDVSVGQTPLARSPLGWFIALEPAAKDRPTDAQWEPNDYPVGLIAVRQIADEEFTEGFFRSRRPTIGRQLDLMLWIRGAYRTMGFGDHHLIALLSRLKP